MKHLKLYEVLGLVVILALTVIAGVSCSKGGPDANLYGVTWVLKSYGQPGNLTPVVTGKEPTLTLDKDKLTISGNGGVNGYGGDFTVKDNDITFSSVMHTLMASTDETLNKQESSFFRILGSANNFQVDGKQLTITGTQGTLVFTHN
jgi:heat shock protein HslJ